MEFGDVGLRGEWKRVFPGEKPLGAEVFSWHSLIANSNFKQRARNDSYSRLSLSTRLPDLPFELFRVGMGYQYSFQPEIINLI